MNRLQTQIVPSAIEFSSDGHYFTATATDTELDGVIQSIKRPLSVIYQVTRRCNFDCDFCSETTRVKDPTLDEIARIQRNLRGVQRVFLSGGEPLLRKDFIEIVSGLALSVSAVVMRSLLDALPFTYQIADVIGAGKLKLIHPIRKGNGLRMADSEFCRTTNPRRCSSASARCARRMTGHRHYDLRLTLG